MNRIGIEFEMWHDGKCYDVHSVLLGHQNDVSGDIFFTPYEIAVRWGHDPVADDTILYKAKRRVRAYIVEQYESLCDQWLQEKRQQA